MGTGSLGFSASWFWTGFLFLGDSRWKRWTAVLLCQVSHSWESDRIHVLPRSTIPAKETALSLAQAWCSPP